MDIEKDPWSVSLLAIYAGITRRAAVEKVPARRADHLPAAALKQLININVTPFLADISLIPIWKIRTITWIAICFFTLGRCMDVRVLRAYQLERIRTPEGKKAIKVCFKISKNVNAGDQAHSVIVEKPNSSTCPVMLLETYYNRCGLIFGREANATDRSYIFSRTAGQTLQHPAGRVQLASGAHPTPVSNYVQQGRELLKEAGWQHLHFTSKSPKVGGVTAAFAANISEDNVRDLGHWQSNSVVHRYRRDLLVNQTQAASALSAHF